MKPFFFRMVVFTGLLLLPSLARASADTVACELQMSRWAQKLPKSDLDKLRSMSSDDVQAILLTFDVRDLQTKMRRKLQRMNPNYLSEGAARLAFHEDRDGFVASRVKRLLNPLKEFDPYFPNGRFPWNYSYYGPQIHVSVLAAGSKEDLVGLLSIESVQKGTILGYASETGIPRENQIVMGTPQMMNESYWGVKTNTVRTGHRPYKEGEYGQISLAGQDHVNARVFIERVIHTTYTRNNLPKRILAGQGPGTTYEGLLKGTREFYPDFNEGDEITIVTFRTLDFDPK